MLTDSTDSTSIEREILYSEESEKASKRIGLSVMLDKEGVEKLKIVKIVGVSER